MLYNLSRGQEPNSDHAAYISKCFPFPDDDFNEHFRDNRLRRGRSRSFLDYDYSDSEYSESDYSEDASDAGTDASIATDACCEPVVDLYFSNTSHGTLT